MDDTRVCGYSKCAVEFPRGNRRRYCSRLHKEKARKEDRAPTRPCQWCGHQFATKGQRRYCSTGCSWAGARYVTNAEKNAGSLDLRCGWIPPAPVERYRGAYYRALQADPCAYCGEPRGGSIDHIVPTSSGGENEQTNIIGACQSCNSAKHARPLLRFLLLRQVSSELEPLLIEYAAIGEVEKVPYPMKFPRARIKLRPKRG